MKSLKTLVIASLAAASLTLAVDANAQQHGAGHSGGMSHGWHGGSLGAAVNHGGWHGGGSAWHGGGGWHGGGWRGGYYPRYSFYLGVPFLWPSYYYYWSSPYAYYPYEYTYPAYMYGPETMQQQPMEEEPTAQAAPGPGSPTQGPLYMNYCESSKAYYPKVASCPEGWKFIAPN